MELKVFYFNPLRECCYVIWDETSECAIVDPGCSSDDEFSRLEDFVKKNGLKPVKILLTHGHFDHIASAEDAATKWGIDIFMNDNDICQVENAHNYGMQIGFEKQIKMFSRPSVNVEDGMTVNFGNTELSVLSTPGHTRGGVCYYCEKDKILFSGDTLFAGSIGRTDTPGGDYDLLITSIAKKIAPLPFDVEVFPGHGYATSIGDEMRSNPFLQPIDFQQISL